MSQTTQVISQISQKLEAYGLTVSLVFFPDGKRAVHVSKCGVATLIQAQDGCRRIGSWKIAANVATVSTDGKWIVCGCSDGKVRIVDAATLIVSETNEQHSRKISALDVSSGSSMVASGSLDGSVIVWSITTGQRLAGPSNLVQIDDHHGGKVAFVTFSRCGNRLAGCVNNLSILNQRGTVYILDIHENQLTKRVVATFDSWPTALLWSENVDGQHRILAGLEEMLAVVDPLHGESDSRKPIPSLRALSKNGKFIVSGAPETGIRFWDAATFAEIGLGRRFPSCHPLAFSPNNTLISVSWNAPDHLSSWDLTNILSKFYITGVADDQTSPISSTATLVSCSRELGLGTAAAFNTMLAEIQLSPNPQVHRNSRLYANPSQKKDAETIISDVLKRRPPVLIDTRTGCLCYGPLRILTLEVDLVYEDLLSSISNLNSFRQGVESFFEYAMFSHKWDESANEPSFQDVSGGSVYHDLGRSPTNDKLRKFCEVVRETGYRWAWSDTCCIDRSDPFVLNKAIVSMYRWYKESTLTLAFLASIVSPSKRGDLRDSIWMTRAWTLQELLAPRAVRFYDSEWKPYLNDPLNDHRDSPLINAELVAAVSVTSRTILTFDPSYLSVREKLRLASTRSATKEEDVAYSLFGIFASDLQPSYGEGKDALGRLLEEIIHRSKDVTALAWSGRSSRFNSCLPAEITVYREPPKTVSSCDTNKLKTRTIELQSALPREVAIAIHHQIANLPQASFSNRRLHLPCIIFPVSRLTVVPNESQPRLYLAFVSILGDVTIKTVDSLPSPLRESHGLILAHPWISDLLHVPASLTPDDYSRALWLVARLGLKFNALLLQQHSYHGYSRVATDNEIVVQLRRVPSAEEIHTQVLGVWDCRAGLP